MVEGLTLVSLGGLGEIGMNCMVLEHGDDVIVIDCGILFSDLDFFGIEFVVPDFSYLMARKDKVRAIVATHGHEDHIGALPFLLRAGIRAPIHSSEFTGRMITERLRESALLDAAELKVFRPGDVIKAGAFKIRPVPVNHSIVEASALIIDTPVGRVIHTGDFKIDPTPYYGKELDLAPFRMAGDEGVLLLLSDSTNVEVDERSGSDAEIYQAFEKVLAAAEGMTIISMFASNVGRVGQVMELARRFGKRVAVTGRSMEQNIELAGQSGYLKDAHSVLISLEDVDSVARKDLIVLATGSQGEYRSALTRIANGEHRLVKLQGGDKVLLSSKNIPGNERAISRTINNLFRQGAEVLYDALHKVHVSGHACRPELRIMLEAVRPKFFVPIHGEYRHLVHHAELARGCGVPAGRSQVVNDYEVVRVTPETLSVVDKLEDNRVYVEGREGGDITKTVLKSRRQMAETGVLFALMTREAESKRLLSGPEIVLRGLVREEMESSIIEKSRAIALKLADEAVRQAKRGETAGLSRETFEESVRIEIRRYLNQVLGKKPVVVPVVIEV